MMPKPLSIYETKMLNLEQEKIDLDRERNTRENRFFNRNLGVIVSSIVAGATVVLSILEFTKNLQQDDRRATISVVELLAENPTIAQDKHKLINMIRAILPEEARNLLENALRDGASNVGEISALQAAGLEFPTLTSSENSSKIRTVFIHFSDEIQRTIAVNIAATLKDKGYNVPGIELFENSRSAGALRYYYEDQEESADELRTIAAAALEILMSNNQNLLSRSCFDLQSLADRFDKLPRGRAEIWLPPPPTSTSDTTNPCS